MPLESFAEVNVLAALKALIILSKICHATT